MTTFLLGIAQFNEPDPPPLISIIIKEFSSSVPRKNRRPIVYILFV